MRWSPRGHDGSRSGDTRVVSRFLLLPKTLPVFDPKTGTTGPQEVRWMEPVKIRQTLYSEVVHIPFSVATEQRLRWHDSAFMLDPEP